ncbi:Transcriptional coactivator Hfi1/Transcriptional adapter 1 [Senna tora]|uniref:Transcriptional coactivator Hfi1/Transcriptional adapter 1 n=1 Tax=Senna tora TaxID=362788 RepID=A0A834T8E0_9FABA|nr:Transcriptional coactivator Hfi1/Transcriptional adapter 1 [Senna tora]
MQPQQSSRIDLGELRAQIIKKIGVDKSKRYFYYLNKFLSQKLSKTEFDKLCCRILGRENLSLHNHFIKSILKNACQAKTPPAIQLSGPPKSGTLTTNISPGREDGNEHSSASFQNQSQNASIWSNGVLPVSPRKVRSVIRDRKIRDRPSPLGPNGKVDSVSHQSTGTEDSGSKVDMENGTLTPCDYQRPIQQLQAVAELPENERRDAVDHSSEKRRIHGKGPPDLSIVEDGEEVEQSNRLSFSRSPLLAPLGIPYCPASIGGARKALPVVGAGDFVSCYDSGWLSDTDTLRRRMEQIAALQGLGSVPVESANTMNNLLDVYLKRLIRSCVDLVDARSTSEPGKPPVHKQQIQGKLINGMWPSNHQHVQSAGGPSEPVPDRRPPCSVSLLDFKVAMELNPQQLGEDWPLLLEKISMHSFEE